MFWKRLFGVNEMTQTEMSGKFKDMSLKVRALLFIARVYINS